VVVPLGLASPAAAAAPGWSRVVDLPAGGATGNAAAVPDPAGGALLFWQRNGVPTISRVSATGAVGAPTAVPDVPNVGDAGTPGSIAFLPSGAAVVGWTVTSSGPYLAYRAANGTWGKPVAAGSSFAVQAGKILVAENDNTGVSVVTRSLSASGSIGSASAAQHVYTGDPTFGVTWLVLDPAGSAELIVNSSAVPTFSQSTEGVWGSEHDLSSDSGAVSIAVASAPSGRAIVGWEEQAPLAASAAGFASVRTPGHDFSAPVSTDSASGDKGGDQAFVRVAAGSDGTLAEATTITKYAQDSSQTTADSVEMATPSQSALGAKHPITGSLGVPFSISAVGAGDSKAIVAATEVNDGPLMDDGTFAENQVVATTEVSSTSSVYQAIASSSGTYGNGKGVPPPQVVDGVSLDAHGLAAAVGPLAAGGPLSYSIEGAHAAPPKPRVTIKSTKVKATATHVPVALACTAAACKGKVTLLIGKKTEAAASYSIKAGKHATIKTKLTKAGKKAFKHAKTHHVKATLKVSVTGGTTVTKKLTVT
jgi:hypothetical protein